MGSAADVLAMSHVLVNTNLAGAAGVIAAIAVSRPILGRVDLLAGLNGAIAGLVSITAGPDITGHYWAIVIGAVGAVICTAAIKLLERLKVNDVVGAVPAHLFAGAWGTIATTIAAGADIGVQLLGVVSIGAFVFVTSWLTWLALEKTMGVRVSRKVEEMGWDLAKLGIDAYPEFVPMPEGTDRLETPHNGDLEPGADRATVEPSSGKHICVYLGGNLGREQRYIDEADALGRLLAAEGIGLVYGGARVGLMGVLASAVLAHGGFVTGVVPRQLSYQELAHEGLSRLLEVDTMHERKHLMQGLSQGCIALPGGFGTFGTLEEIFEALCFSLPARRSVRPSQDPAWWKPVEI